MGENRNCGGGLPLGLSPKTADGYCPDLMPQRERLLTGIQHHATDKCCPNLLGKSSKPSKIALTKTHGGLHLQADQTSSSVLQHEVHLVLVGIPVVIKPIRLLRSMTHPQAAERAWSFLPDAGLTRAQRAYRPLPQRLWARANEGKMNAKAR